MKNFIQNLFVLPLFLILFLCISVKGQDLKKLEKLANYLETVPDNRFDMTRWGSQQDPYSPRCAAGHATDIFSSEGFNLRGISVYYKDFYNTEACTEFFELSLKDFNQLFSNININRKQEIVRIRRFIATRQIVASL